MANAYKDWPPKRAQLRRPHPNMLMQKAQQQRQHIRPDGLHALITAAKTPTIRKRSAPSSRHKPMHSHPWRSNKSQQGITVSSGVPEAAAWTPGTTQKSDTSDSGAADSASSHPLMLLTKSQTPTPGRSWQRSLSGTRQNDYQTSDRFVQKHHLDAAPPSDDRVSSSSAQPVHITTRLPYTPAGASTLEGAVKPTVQVETEALIIKVDSLQAETLELQARAADRQKYMNSGTRRTEFSRTDQGSHQSTMRSPHVAPAINLWVSSPSPGSPPARAFSNSNADLSGDFRLTSQLGSQFCQTSPLPHGVLHRPVDPLHIRARKSLIRPATTPEGKQRPNMRESGERPATQQSGRRPTALEATKWSSKWAPIGLGDSSASGLGGNVEPPSSHHLGMRDNVRSQTGLAGDWQSWSRDPEGSVQHAQHSGCRVS